MTWLGEEKAIAMAVGAHLRRYGIDQRISDVEEEDLGPVDRDRDGAMKIDHGDLTDRLEI